jgi:hypothetical protein
LSWQGLPAFLQLEQHALTSGPSRLPQVSGGPPVLDELLLVVVPLDGAQEAVRGRQSSALSPSTVVICAQARSGEQAPALEQGGAQ